MGQATGPIYTCETTGHAPAAVLDAHPERYVGLASENTKLQGRMVLHMRLHEACCFSMMRTNVLDALVAIE